ncbi:MAG: hypothetical protein U9R08_03650 [Nanoarchaeota archaeon]|nr:hypothetical protein [Nanoarchaeota archaeon]
MNVDKETAPSYVNITILDTKNHIESMRNEAIENDINEKDKKWLQLMSENLSGEEYYFEDGEIQISSNAITKNGEAQVYLNIKLSDTVLIDILEYSIKRFNKLKSVLETLK